jgi:hypothetical protein
MGGTYRLGFLLVAISAVVVGAWIGYRATDNHGVLCFATARGAIACVNPERGKDSYRSYFIEKGQVRSLP